jgi:hypothetical protein
MIFCSGEEVIPRYKLFLSNRNGYCKGWGCYKPIDNKQHGKWKTSRSYCLTCWRRELNNKDRNPKLIEEIKRTTSYGTHKNDNDDDDDDDEELIINFTSDQRQRKRFILLHCDNT